MPSRPLGKVTTAAVFVLGVVVVVAPERRALVDAAAGVAAGAEFVRGGDYLRELGRARRGLR